MTISNFRSGRDRWIPKSTFRISSSFSSSSSKPLLIRIKVLFQVLATRQLSRPYFYLDLLTRCWKKKYFAFIASGFHCSRVGHLSPWPPEFDDEVGGDLLPSASEKAILTIAAAAPRESMPSPSMNELIFNILTYSKLSSSVEPDRQDTNKRSENRKGSRHTMSDNK